MDHEVWCPVRHNSRSKTNSERNYGKVDGESLGVVNMILSKQMYLYGAQFEVMLDHKPLVSLYNSNSRDLPVRVAKHRSKLRGFNFKVVWEPGTTSPANYGSHNPSPMDQYAKLEKDQLGIEDEEEDTEIIVNIVEKLYDAVTIYPGCTEE